MSLLVTKPMTKTTMFTECFEFLSVHGWGKQLCKVLIINLYFLNSSLLYARPVKKRKEKKGYFMPGL